MLQIGLSTCLREEALILVIEAPSKAITGVTTRIDKIPTEVNQSCLSGYYKVFLDFLHAKLEKAYL
jgi:hypothetical protein